MEKTAKKQYAPSVGRVFQPASTQKASHWKDNRPEHFSNSRLIAAIQRATSSLQMADVITPVQRKSTSTVIQRFPSHRDIQVADGTITARELLEILEAVAQEEFANLQGKATTDWFGQFARLPDPPDYTFPGPSPDLSYDHSSIRKTFQVGGISLVNMGTNNYIHAEGNPSGDDITSYPKLSEKITGEEKSAGKLDSTGQKERASQIRSYIATPLHWTANRPVPQHGGPIPNMQTHLAVTTAALFGAETSRSHRAYITNMMLLDRMEAQQTYGKRDTKTLTLPKLLHSQDYPGTGNDAFFNLKKQSLESRHPGLLPTLTDASIPPRSIAHIRGNRTIHGGKAPMAGQWTQKMGKAALPQNDGDPLNIVQAKEINVLIHWLRLQLGLDILANTKKSDALRWIKVLVQERIKNYYLMNGQARQRYFTLLLHSSLPGINLFIQQFIAPMLHQLPVLTSPSVAIPAPSFPMAMTETVGRPVDFSFQTVNRLLVRMNLFAGKACAINLVKGIPLQSQLLQYQKELTKIYHQAALRIHPDKRKDKDDTEFKLLQQIWDTLKALIEGKSPSEVFELADTKRKALL